MCVYLQIFVSGYQEILQVKSKDTYVIIYYCYIWIVIEVGHCRPCKYYCYIIVILMLNDTDVCVNMPVLSLNNANTF